MGHMERRVAVEIRRTKINSAIIGTLAIGGMLAIAAVAPNVLGAMGRLGVLNFSQKRQGVKKSLTRLIRKGYVTIQESGGKKCVRLTTKGEKFAALMGEGKLAPKKPKRWDGKWRMLIFDVPEKRKQARRRIREILHSIGFQRLQDSVWVYPYDCEDLVMIMKAELKIGKDVLYVIADAIEHDKVMRSHFDL
ncbi:CRISPR-associated endonuclease Cas2 [Candidatus Kaiserbacteria bacterium]|nr:CRISPR-associated endonuclease Cas2 [Candidatus Kaiserbacteria bacterium]